MSNSPEFHLCYSFWQEFDILGSMTWNIQPRIIEMTFYYNDENVDVEIMPYRLNLNVKDSPRLLANGWRPNVKMLILKPEPWVQDYYKKVALRLTK